MYLVGTRLAPALVASSLALLLTTACGGPAPEPANAPEPAPLVVAPTEGVVTTSEGVEIVFESRGAGETAVVLVHCWSCNMEFWREQVDALDDDYRVIRMDLPGHGRSGFERASWSILELGRDVAQLVEELELERVIFVGHSMGGPVSLEAARQLPGRALGVVAVDTLHNADFEFPERFAADLAEQLEADFESSMKGFVGAMIAPDVAPEVREWILDQARLARPEVAAALMRDFPTLDPPAMFREAGVPIRAINAAPIEGAAPGEGPAPTNVEGNRAYADFDAILMEDVFHFPHLEQPAAFNEHLRRVLAELAALREAAPAAS